VPDILSTRRVCVLTIILITKVETRAPTSAGAGAPMVWPPSYC